MQCFWSCIHKYIVKLNTIMSGDKLTKKLRQLGVPDTDKLQGPDYDWIFMNQDENKPLINFLEWFIENVHPDDVLTDKELNE